MKVWARTQHAPLYAVMRKAVRLHLRNKTMYLPTASFVSSRRTFMGIFDQNRGKNMANNIFDMGISTKDSTKHFFTQERFK